MNENEIAFDEEYAKKIIRFLGKRAPKFRCPACKHEDFALVKGYHMHHLQNERKGYSLGKGAVAVTVVCKNCGLLFDFSVKVIEDDENNKKGS